MTRGRGSILVAAVVSVVVAYSAIAAARVNGVVLDRPAPVDAFALEDHDGKPFTTDFSKAAGRSSLPASPSVRTSARSRSPTWSKSSPSWACACGRTGCRP